MATPTTLETARAKVSEFLDDNKIDASEQEELLKDFSKLSPADRDALMALVQGAALYSGNASLARLYDVLVPADRRIEAATAIQTAFFNDGVISENERRQIKQLTQCLTAEDRNQLAQSLAVASVLWGNESLAELAYDVSLLSANLSEADQEVERLLRLLREAYLAQKAESSD